jgi:hypothetical protein
MKIEPEIYCPHCAYRPQSEDRWECTPGCGTLWNTFWTGAVCPGCGHPWPDTECLVCGEISPHQDWYHYPEKATATAPAVDSIGSHSLADTDDIPLCRSPTTAEFRAISLDHTDFRAAGAGALLFK